MKARDTELALYRALSTRLPRIRGTGRIGLILQALYCRKPRDPVVEDVLGFQMKLDPAECVDGSLLFAPQVYDWREREFLMGQLRRGDVFLDVGANIGFYSLCMSRLVGPEGKVLAIEADPDTFLRLSENVTINDARNIQTLPKGVADERQTLRLHRNTTGNRGGNSFLPESPRSESVMVPCFPLHEILEDAQIRRVAAAKFDIEGMEYKVLTAFFQSAPVTLHPKAIVLEDQPAWHSRMGGDPVELLSRFDYRIVRRQGINVHLVKHI